MAMTKKTNIKELKTITSEQTAFSVFGDVLIEALANNAGNLSGNLRPETATTVMAKISPRFNIDPKNIRSEIAIREITLIT